MAGGPHVFWLVVHDHRFGLDYEIASHCDYWDFIGALVEHRRCTSLQRESGVMVESVIEPDVHRAHGEVATVVTRC